ncbi:MAG: response regulator [Alphaproteobacteria bacterium]|nr:response regulator [Alphaproteobacteria bacterium]
MDDSQRLSDVLALMSHEIRAPMNGIMEVLEGLRATPLDPRQRDQVETIHHSGGALLAVLDAVLDVAREPKTIAFEPERLIAGVVDLMSSRARTGGLSIDTTLDPTVPRRVRGDAAGLRQVLLTLIGNAIRFTHKGGVRVAVVAAAGGLRFEVIDTGIGMPAEARAGLFEGRRLAACRRVVAALGGEIGVESTPGLGSLFWFTMTVAPVDAAAPSAVAPLWILVADDDPVGRKVAIGLLERQGHQVQAVADGGAALAEIASGRPCDLVLMDVEMPVMDGLAATRAIRALPGAAGRVPVIALTAAARDGDALRCREAGMDDHVAKPIEMPSLIAAIARQTRQEPVAPPLVDRDALLKLFKLLGPRSGAEMIETARQVLTDGLATIRAALGEGDVDTARRAAHRMTSSAGHAGLAVLRGRLQDIERSARAGRGPEVEALAEGLDDLVARSLAQLDGELRQPL